MGRSRFQILWEKFLNEGDAHDLDVLKNHLLSVTNYGDEEIDYYLESVRRDLDAGGDRASQYKTWEMDDYAEDLENYILGRLD